MFVIKPLKRKIIFYGSSFCKLWAEIQNHARLCAENCPGQVYSRVNKNTTIFDVEGDFVSTFGISNTPI